MEQTVRANVGIRLSTKDSKVRDSPETPLSWDLPGKKSSSRPAVNKSSQIILEEVAPISTLGNFHRLIKNCELKTKNKKGIKHKEVRHHLFHLLVYL